MKKIFSEFNISLTEKQEKAFEKYYEELIYYNSMFNITAITDRKEVIIKHFIDSVYNVDNVDNFKNANLIDIGSGGGFPALPLKIMNENLSVTLVEATGKKCEFLKTIIKELELDKCSVINDRAETLAKDEKYREKFDICTARAVARLNTLTEYCLPFVRVNGVFMAYKGDAEEEIIQSENAVKILGGKLKKVDNYTIDGAKRAIITIEKVSSTPAKYPRGNGKERKKPL